MLFLAANRECMGVALDLEHYELAEIHLLPDEASEASAVTYDWDSGTLFVVGDSAERIVEVSLQGSLISSMPMTGFEDTESISYRGSSQFLIGEERLQSLYAFSYMPDQVLQRGNLQEINLGPNAGNSGIEGLSYDPLTGKVLYVKEKNPQELKAATIDFGSGTVSTQSLFSTDGLMLADLADLQALSTVPAYGGSDLASHLLVLSQASSRLLETDRAGNILGSLDLSSLSSTIEGVTIDGTGTIYLVDESPRLYILRPVPEPASAGLLITGMLAAAGRRWGRARRH